MARWLFRVLPTYIGIFFQDSHETISMMDSTTLIRGASFQEPSLHRFIVPFQAVAPCLAEVFFSWQEQFIS